MLTVQQFFQNWPEFAQTNPVYVQACIGRAASRMGGPDYSVWGNPTTPTTPPAPPAILTNVDSALGNLAAHYLISGPYGTNLRLDPKGNGRSMYLRAFEDLELTVAGGFAVASRPV
jgi:hypothetical protein